MTCSELFTYLQESAVDCLPTSFLDTNPSQPLSGTSTAATSYGNEQPMDGSLDCTCWKGTFDCSIHPNTRDAWIASQRDSLAKTLAGLGIKPGSEREREADFTAKCSELLTSFDHGSCSWKTSQQSLLTNSLEPFLQTWPRAGLMRAGLVYQHRQPVPRTTVIGGGALQSVPTPMASDATNWSNQSLSERKEKKQQIRLPTAVSPQGGAGGKLSPDWVEWLMGLPIGHTALKPLETAKCQPKQRRRGQSSEGQ